MKHRYIYSIALLLFLCSPAFGSNTFELNDRVQQAYLAIMRLKFEEGKQLLDEEQLVNPSNSLPLLYYNYIDFLKACISEEKKDFDAFNSNMDIRLHKLQGTASPFYLYARTELMLQDAMLRIKFRHFISAAWEIKKAYTIMKRNITLYPAFPLNKKISGLLHVLVGAVPENYRWLVRLSGMEGTLPQGIEELSSLQNELEGTNYMIYKEEILFYRACINIAFSTGDTQALSFAEQLKPFYQHSLLMRYCYTNLLLKAGRNDDALQALSHFTEPANTFRFHLLSYKSGLIKLYKLDRSAEVDFKNFIAHFHGINYIRAAYQKLAWISLLNGNRDEYDQYINRCKLTGSAFTDEDKEATAEAERNESPNLPLLRARLYFDGGYYKQSLAEIAGKAPENFPRYKDQLEVTYRFARILFRLNELDKAIDYFEQTLKNGASSGYYFAANAALFLGIIYEEKNETEKAKGYYTKCLSLRNHEYQNSIDQKAKAGLERMNVKK